MIPGDPARKGWKGMLRYSIKRILLALLTVLIIAAITFFAMNAIPGGPFSSGKGHRPGDAWPRWKRVTGWISPLGEQFVNYLTQPAARRLGRFAQDRAARSAT